MSAKIPVGILGATGTVGQKFVRLLADHPWFEIAAVCASEASAGRPYGEAARWREPAPIPEPVTRMLVRPATPPLDVPVRIVFSALDAAVARPIEEGFAAAGVYVVTNTRNLRMDPDVPLLVPEVNADHLALLHVQQRSRGWPGGVVANPNCSTAALVLALAPLHQAFGVTKAFVATMQAVSGAGYPGVASLDIVGNVIPHIGGEEEKIETEMRKILGALAGEGDAVGVTEADVVVSAHANRVPVIDGHTEVVSVGLARRATPGEAVAVLRDWTGHASVRGLPSSPARPVEVDERADRPQPRLDLERGRGMTVTVGRVRPCRLLDLRLALLGHNTLRGAAGAAVQNAELLVAQGWVPRG